LGRGRHLEEDDHKQLQHAPRFPREHERQRERLVIATITRNERDSSHARTKTNHTASKARKR
jgi:hypothetical protein